MKAAGEKEKDPSGIWKAKFAGKMTGCDGMKKKAESSRRIDVTVSELRTLRTAQGA